MIELKIDATHIGLRAQDIQTSLQEHEFRGLAAGQIDLTRLVGMVERLAIHIRGKEVIKDQNVLAITASQLGVDSLVLPRVLDVMQQVDFIQIRDGLIYDRVPYFTNIYDVMGEYWKSNDPTETDRVSIELLNDLTKTALTEEDTKKRYSVEDETFTLVKRLGESGSYYGFYESPKDGSSIIYSPIFWEENPEAFLSLLKIYSAEEIADAISRVQNYQGYPHIDFKNPSPTREEQILVEAMKRGLLPTPVVDSSAGQKSFVFTPYSGGINLSIEEKAILDKARAILACIRYGEHFARVTRIARPEAIIDAILSRKKIGPHSEIRRQYLILLEKGIVRFSRDTVYPDRHWLHLIDSEENIKALRLARDMAVVGEAISERGLNPNINQFMIDGNWMEPMTALADRKRKMINKPGDIEKLLDKLTDEIRESL